MPPNSTLATSCKQLTHWKKLWCWEGSGAGGEGDDRGWDGWMASPTWWTWVWVNSRSWWWTGRPGVLQFMGSQTVGHDWVTELNWTEDIKTMINIRYHTVKHEASEYKTRPHNIGRNEVWKENQMESLLLRELSKMKPGSHWESMTYAHLSPVGIWTLTIFFFFLT